jgi:chromosomal replication initiation ATPase DnaA
MAEIISPYVFPILKHLMLSKKKYPYIGKRYTALSKEDVVAEICEEFGMDREEFFKKRSRSYKFVEPRKLYSYIRVFEMGAKKVHVGNEFNTDHSTIIHACKSYIDLFKTDVDYREKCERVLRKLGFIKN